MVKIDHRIKRLLVLGAGGKVGRMLMRVWAARPIPGWEVVGQYRREAPPRGVLWQPGEPESILGHIDAIFALWGVTPGAPEHLLKENTALAGKALHLGQSLGAERVFLCSSAAVYGAGKIAWPESAGLTGMVSPYGQAKRDMEHLALSHAQATGPARVVLRLANVIGADSLFEALSRGGDVTLDRFPDGTGPRRSFIAPGDLAAGIGRLLQLDRERLPEVLNVAGTRAIAMSDLVVANHSPLVWRKAPLEASVKVELDARRFLSLAGPAPASNDAVAAIADWVRWRGDDE